MKSKPKARMNSDSVSLPVRCHGHCQGAHACSLPAVLPFGTSAFWSHSTATARPQHSHNQSAVSDWHPKPVAQRASHFSNATKFAHHTSEYPDGCPGERAPAGSASGCTPAPRTAAGPSSGARCCSAACTVPGPASACFRISHLQRRLAWLLLSDEHLVCWPP